LKFRMGVRAREITGCERAMRQRCSRAGISLGATLSNAQYREGK
jgi:hypothetical protein